MGQGRYTVRYTRRYTGLLDVNARPLTEISPPPVGGSDTGLKDPCSIASPEVQTLLLQLAEGL